jgi:Ca-activated chloride channel family protein
MRNFRFAFVALLAAVLVGASLAPAGAQNGGSRSRRVGPSGVTAAGEPVFNDDPIELSTDLVNVLFSVTDRTNRFVGDLKQEDIVVTEGGEAQQVFSFRRETNLPLEVALLIDVSSSQEFTFADEKRAAATFLQKVLRPKQDSAAIVKFREDVEYVVGFTERLERVSDGFNRLNWESRASGGSRYGATALYDAVSITASELFPKDQVGTDPGTVVRRAIILISDGEDTASERTMKRAIEDALRSGVIVYAVGIGDRYRSTSVKRDVLEVIANQTGGRAYFPASYADLTTAFRQIEDELRSQYLLAYEPSRIARDGSFREITITVPGRSDLRVFHRKGYFAQQAAAGAPAAPPRVNP